MTSFMSRRQALRTIGVASSLATIGLSLASCATRVKIPLVRRDIGGMNDSDPVVLSYRKAIGEMKALPVTDPRSWDYQAAIHGTTLAQSLPAWRTCEHGTYYFWSWHRMYLYWFERIVQKMSGDCCWALPYWNYSSPTQRQLPIMFRDTTSELFVAARNAAMNDGTGSLSAFVVDTTAGLSVVDFTAASFSLEGTPHNDVHVSMGGWMGSVPTAAQDPVFYLHHSNMDRLWNIWLAQGGGRADPVTDSVWTDRKYLFFTEDGSDVEMTGCEVLRAAEQLNHVYEGEPAQVNQYCLEPAAMAAAAAAAVSEPLIALPMPPIVLGGDVVTVKLGLADVRTRFAEAVESEQETVYLELDDVVAEKQPGIVWEVYLGGTVEGLERDVGNPHFIGTLSLFSTGIRSDSHHDFKPAHFSFPIDRALQAISGERRRDVLLIFVPSGLLIDGKPGLAVPEATVSIGRAGIAVRATTP